MIHPSITIQGNIISGEILEKIHNEELAHQTPAAFGLSKNARVRDEIGLAWSTIRGLWQTFRIRKERLAADESGTTETRNFWMLPFLTTLGYDVEKANAEILDDKTYAISHRATNLQGFPVHIMGINDSLDKRRETSGPRLSPHALVQEYLNKAEDHLYALVTNGRHLRLLRDATRLVRLTYLEFDLEKMMEEELFSDFALLYRVLHASRMPQEKGDGESSIIEQYHQDSLEAGTRIREKLSLAVEYAIKQLANGFLQHPHNEYLRQQIHEGQLTPQEFYLQSLRLVYRMLFLLVIEDRGLVYPDKLDEKGKKLRQVYLNYYSMNRLRQMAARKLFVEAGKYDLWENLKVAFHLFVDARYGQKLGIQPLGSGIFDPDALGNLAETRLNNQELLEVMQRICYFDDKERQLRVKVNYGDLDVEEFGSVYEGLLEYKPVFIEAGGKLQFTFEAGTERSSSGSHYTPEELVRPLIKHSLDYLIDDCLKKPHERLGKEPGKLPLKILQENALLDLKVADVACGSGHILLSAARRIAMELARVRTGEDQPSPTSMRQAIRDTIRHCIYGVDKNPLAVELCKVALWLEAHNPGEPLNFLDHKIKCGDSIVGLAHREELQNGIADEAFKLLSGDDKMVAKTFRDQNKKERKERVAKQTQLKAEFEESTTPVVSEDMETYMAFTKLPETTPEEIARKQRAYEKYLDGKGHQWLRRMADTQVAQFFIPKTPENQGYLITDADYRQMLAGYKGWQGQKPIIKAELLAGEKGFLHWFIEFPEVFEKGGFDCILGNPPFLGGKRISGNYGDSYLNYLKVYYEPSSGGLDLATYFFRRIFQAIKINGFQSLISTNTISQGDSRIAGLEYIIKKGGLINFAIKSIKWPGLAAVEVSLLAIFKGDFKSKYLKTDQEFNFINSYLNYGEELFPFQMFSNKGKSFMGSIPLGKGFILNSAEAKHLTTINNENRRVIFPYLNGDDLNNNYNQETDRWIINFFDWEFSFCKNNFPECFEIVQKLVKPERDIQKDKGYREKWWQFGRRGVELYKSIKSLPKIIVVARTSKTLGFSLVDSNQVLNANLTVISSAQFELLSFLQSTIHSVWAWQYATKLKTDLIYQPTDIFETFPFPQNLSPLQEKQLESIGGAYDEHRRQLMLSIQLGLTKTYNAFHAREIQAGITTAELQQSDKKAIEKKYGKELWNLWNHLQKTEGTCTLEEAIDGIVKLRELHVQMDQAVLEAYGWAVIQLRHNFYEVDYLPENDRTRYTIHPDARKEVLKRLLQLNHQYFEEEARQGLHKEETVRKFYDQKGTAIPEEVSKWFEKGKKPKVSPKITQIKQEQTQLDLFKQEITSNMKEFKLQDGIYYISDVASIIGQPYDKVRRWFRKLAEVDYEGLEPSVQADIEQRRISFHGLVELVVIGTLLEENFSIQKIFKARKDLAEKTGKTFPFATNNVRDNLKAAGKSLIFRFKDGLVTLDGKGNYNLDFIKEFFRDIEFDSGIAIRYVPSKGLHRIVIDPRFGGGKPSIVGSYGVTVETIENFYTGPESIPEIMEDYNLSIEDVNAAIAYLS